MMMTLKHRTRLRALAGLALAAVVAVIALFATSGATATAKTNVAQQASENWAGYVVTGKKFSSVSGSWTEPSVKTSSNTSDAYSAMWVGLGGAGGGSSSLEQVGTAADYVNGQVQYYAWYELLPAGQVNLNIAIHPGDKISAKVSVSGSNVTVSLSDLTTGHSAVKTLRMSSPNASSAEWIVEAPSAQFFGNNYQVLPLADFGKVTFTKATATANGHTGGVTDSAWSATRVQLSPATGVGAGPGPGFAAVGPQRFSQQSSAGATTSTVSGKSFSVTWQGARTSQAAVGNQSAVGQYPAPGDGFPGGASGYGPGPY
jgi:hypothetical protein